MRYGLPGDECIVLSSLLPAPHAPPQFPKPTVRAVARLFNDCSSGLQLLSVAACAGEREQQP